MSSESEQKTDHHQTSQPPPLSIRWFYAFEDGWQAFNDEDDGRLEERWHELEKEGGTKKKSDEKEEQDEDNEERKKNEQSQINQNKGKNKLSWPPSGVDQIRLALFGGNGDKSKSLKEEEEAKSKQKAEGVLNDDGQRIVTHHLDPDEPKEKRRKFVEVMEDNLFDVNLETMELFPVFWKGVLLRVVRAHWFYLSSDGGFAPIPFDEDLSNDLDKAFDNAQPWKHSNDSKDEGNMLELPSMPNQGRIRFEGASSGRIFTQDLSGKVLSVLGGSLVIRGWKETVERSKQLRNTSIFNSSFLPWAGGQTPNEREKGEMKDDELENDSLGSARAQRREGAAKASKQPPSQEENKGSANAQEENQGWLGKLWPSTDSLTKPKVNFLRSIGWSKEDAIEEGQRSGRQKNTEEALKNEKGSEDAEGDGEVDQDAEDSAEPIPEDRVDDPPELVLAIHGIGQKLTDDFDAIDFVYDIERLRNLSKKCAEDPAIKTISRGKRAQFLPICWRKELSFDDQEALEGNDNVYGLRDVSNDATIPMVRTIISKVILDVPYYLSRHKKTMIEAVVQELNRVYRLFVRRNPDFEKRGGRVSLICHSLGSALAADILSFQPTRVSPLADQTHEQSHSKEHLVFNVKNLFFVGSPNGFFFHLQGAQMIARKGTLRTQDVEEDAARDEVGRYGCLAAESIYNCYNATDPVAFQLSATVDREYAQMLKPISIPDAVPALLEALSKPRLSLSKYFQIVHPFTKNDRKNEEEEVAKHPGASVEKASHSGTSSPLPPIPTTNRRINPQRSSSIEEIGKPVLIEKGSEQKVHQVKAKVKGEKSSFDLERLQRAERRFRALNPHGCVDFIYDSGGVNQYLDMLSAHVSYWTSKSFASFVLTQLFSDFETNSDVPTVVPRLMTENEQEQQSEQPQKEGEGQKDHQNEL